MSSIPRSRAKILLAGATFVAGCSLHPGPDMEIETAQRALADAVHAHAAEHAAPELALAREKIALARRWAEAKDYRPAKWLAEQAQVDAELAAMRALSARARAGAAQATDEFRRISAAASPAK
jgi:hypothetical protein